MDRRWLLRLALVLAVFVNNANFSATTVALPGGPHVLSPRLADPLDGLLSGSAPAHAALAGLPAQARVVAAAAVRGCGGSRHRLALACVAVIAGAGACSAC